MFESPPKLYTYTANWLWHGWAVQNCCHVGAHSVCTIQPYAFKIAGERKTLVRSRVVCIFCLFCWCCCCFKPMVWVSVSPKRGTQKMGGELVSLQNAFLTSKTVPYTDLFNKHVTYGHPEEDKNVKKSKNDSADCLINIFSSLHHAS